MLYDKLADSPDLTLLGALKFNLDRARCMLEGGAKVNTERDGAPPLHSAAFSRNLLGIELLLKHRADVNFKTRYYEMTALHCAASRQNTYEVFQLLLKCGAKANSKNLLGATPFLYALRYCDMRVVDLFLKYGADVTAVDKDGKTALHYAAANTDVEVIRFALEQGCDLECSDNDDYSALHHAAKWGNSEGCEFLLRQGAMVNKKSTKTEDTPLSLLISAPQSDVQILLDYDANVAEKVGGKSILEMAAAEKVDEDIRHVLMQHVAKLEFFKLGVEQYDLQTIENEDCYRDYYKRCLEELEFMTRTILYDDVSIFNIVMDSEDAVAEYAKIDKLVQALEEEDYDSQFPIYFSSLKSRFYAEVDKHRSVMECS